MFEIDPDIARAEGPPPSFYGDPAAYRATLERVLARTWHLVTGDREVRAPHTAKPEVLLPGSLDEPLVFTRDDERLRCLSNVCTHRAARVCDAAGPTHALRCPYHGRRFDLDGAMLSMPEFEGVADFPSARDDLAEVPFALWGGQLFAGVAPDVSFEEAFAPLAERLGFAPFADMVLDEEASRDYELDANWALYAENYLEGFHVPYVHRSLATRLDYGAYRTEVFEHCSLQIGVVGPGEPAFDLPPGHPDHGERIGGFYAALFPTTMINLYPWGVSLNLIHPLGPSRTRVCYRFWVWRPELREQGPGSDLHRVELEDEEVVQRVQIGVRSRFARPARYSVRRERGVHHFHRLLARYLAT